MGYIYRCDRVANSYKENMEEDKTLSLTGPKYIKWLSCYHLEGAKQTTSNFAWLWFKICWK